MRHLPDQVRGVGLFLRPSCLVITLDDRANASETGAGRGYTAWASRDGYFDRAMELLQEIVERL